MRKESHSSPLVAKQRVRANIMRERRVDRQQAYHDAAPIFLAAREGDVALLKARWLLARCGYVETRRVPCAAARTRE